MKYTKKKLASDGPRSNTLVGDNGYIATVVYRACGAPEVWRRGLRKSVITIRGRVDDRDGSNNKSIFSSVPPAHMKREQTDIK